MFLKSPGTLCETGLAKKAPGLFLSSAQRLAAVNNKAVSQMESELPWECAGPREASLSPTGDQSCPQIRRLFGLENTSEVMESKVPIIHSRLFPFSCLSSLPDPILPKAEQPQPLNQRWNSIHSPAVCPWVAQERGRVIPEQIMTPRKQEGWESPCRQPHCQTCWLCLQSLPSGG